MSTNLHAHMESRVSDCDGPLDRDWVVTMPEVPEGTDVSDAEYAFRSRVLASMVSTQGEHDGTLSVRTFDDGTSRLSWAERTEEGYRMVEATFCVDESCDPEAHGQRDHFAEAMGY